jgi:predicted amidohydrolase
MMSDGRTSVRANNGHKNHETVERQLPPQPRLRFDARLRMAAIGFRVAISSLQGTSHCGEDLWFRQPRPDSIVVPPELHVDPHLGRTETTGVPVDPWHHAICAQVKRSLDRGAEIVVLPEFGLPPVTNRPTTIQNELRAACAQATSEYFVFAGTRHEDRHNRGLILSRRDGRVLTSDYWHHKHASARSLGENVMGPSGTAMRSYETDAVIGADNIQVAVAICFDTYDPTTFLNLFLDTVRHLKGAIPRVILVPSFNPSTDFVALLRDLSFLARCTVIYVNGLHGDAKMFMCGFDIEDFDDARRRNIVFSSITTRRQELQNDIQQIQANAAGGAINAEDQRLLQEKSDQLNELKILGRRLTTLQGMGELDNIITFEDCATCGSGALHMNDRSCFRDIQYFNISRALLSTLFDFRKVYFGEEQFLPEPFRRDNLDQAALAIDGP